MLPICSIIFSGLLCIVYFSKKRINLVENTVYSFMIIASFIDSILVSILQTISVNGITQFENIIVAIFNKIDFMMLIAICNCLFLYTLLIAYKNARANFNKVLKLSIMLDAIAALFIVFSNVNIINQGTNYSIAGNSIYITIALCVIYILSALIIAIVNIKNADKRYIPIFSIIGIIIFLIFLYNINPYLIIISITLTFINYLMYFTIQNPDVKMIGELEIAKDNADKANRAKTDFLSSMSHEIRTPLNAIVGFSDCINNASTLEEAKENAKDVINASQTLLEIVNGILDISKIEAGKLEIVNSPYNAKRVFEELAKLITPKMNEKALDFTYNIAPDLPETLYGDHANIKKIITNLLSNACKYTDKGSVHYEVSCFNVNGICKLIVSVEDTGRGIKKENVDKLFTKFQRLEEDRNTTIEGTGLGLAITKQLVELMGGKIIVHTVYGEGSKFTVTFDQRIEEVKLVENEKIINTELNLKDKKILIVDDNVLNIKVATKLLQRFHANDITAFENGFDCLNDIENGSKYDVILLDDMMPKMSGVETLKKLHEIPKFNIPVVALTANAITGMKEKYLSEGFNNYLAKPIEKDELVRVLNEVLALKDNTTEEVETLEIFEYEEPFEEASFGKEYLMQNGVNIEKSLELLGDMEMYNMTITDFVNELPNKWTNIEKYKNENDMENYAIEVHSLKSDCKYLGFTTLADISYQHELKSKENDQEFVISNFDKLESEYKNVKRIATLYVENLTKSKSEII